MKISTNIIRKILVEELQKLREAPAKEDESKTSSQISASAETLKKAIEAFTAENLPDVPTELASALETAEKVLQHMSDNPGQYKGGPSSPQHNNEGGY